MRGRTRLIAALVIAAAFVAASVLLVSHGPDARAQQAPSQQTGIRVRGQGSVTAAPDLATLSLTATLRRETPAAAFEALARDIERLNNVLRANGVGERDIQTRGLNLAPEFVPVPPPTAGAPAPTPMFAGWRASQTVSIRLRDFARLGATITAAVNALGEGAQVGGVSFGIEGIDALTERARELAAADAREKAELLATRLGGRLGRLVYAQEVSAPGPAPVPAATATPRPATPTPGAGPPPPPIQVAPGEQTVTVVIEAVWELE